MTDQPTPDPISADTGTAAAARRARLAALATQRSSQGRRHPAQGARIAAAGIGATAMLGLVGVMGLAQHASDSTPVAAPQPQVVVVVHRPGTLDAAATTATPSSGTVAARRLTARPTVRPASSSSRTPSASTNGSR